MSALIMIPATLYSGSLLVEAESFDSHGGWVVDQQFVEQMGSPYLMAHGLGKPVSDAVTTVAFPSTGRYRLWVRTKNWVPGPWEAPGRFQVLINGEAVPVIFGTEDGWQWQDGGTVEIADTEVQLALRDLTGFNARCDALYFDKDTTAVPPEETAQQRRWLNPLIGLPDTPPDGGNFDVIIVGGGIAGCAAALAADEYGLKVALVQDRPVLGGNASSEVRVHTLGIYGKGRSILEQLDTEHWPNSSPKAIIDQEKRDEAMSEAENVTFFMPWRAYDVHTSGNRITSVDISCVTSSKALRLYADVFIDCTGDGWIGYWAGADYRYGRESRDEFGEAWERHGDLWSPDEPDNKVMGSSLLWYSSVTDRETEFPEIPWAMDVAKDHSALSGEWYWEYSSDDMHQIEDAEAIRDHLLRAIFGSFANAKNNPANAKRHLDWVGYISGKRESRRLIGDHIYTMQDARSGTVFADTVVEETRAIDLHYQRAEIGSPYDFLANALFYRVPRYYIPFRSLYSRNIENLMMAGRNFSCSHVGLGGPRVMRTTGQMGIAVGYAAVLCEKYDTTPRGVYEDHIDELRAMIGYRSPPAWLESAGRNYSMSATISVSGTLRAEYDKKHINDGNNVASDNAKRWVSAEGVPDWVQWHWAEQVAINAARIISGWNSQHGVRDPLTGFHFEYHNGEQWQVIPESRVTGNDDIEWAGLFDTIETDRLRLVITATPDAISRIWEIELFNIER